MKKIYIIGPSGSGKTTLARALSKKYNIKHYELDKIIYDDDHEHRKRSDKEIDKLFNKILKQKSWIIEDVGRSNFIKGRELSDIIYYLKVPKIIIYKRVVVRWVKQRLGKEIYNYPPTLYQFIDMLRIANKYLKKEKSKLASLKEYNYKIKYINIKEVNNLEKI